MIRALLGFFAALGVLFGNLLPSAPASYSQQPAAVDLTWDVAPIGLLADQRLRAGIGQAVNTDSILSDAGLTGSLRYDGSPFSQGQGRTQAENVRLLFAAAGFDNPPAQMRQVRRCYVWVAPTVADAAKRQMIATLLGKAISTGMDTLGLTVQCEAGASAEEADITVWPSSQASPYPPGRHDLEAEGFMAPLPRPAPALAGTRPVTPPASGDGGLLRR